LEVLLHLDESVFDLVDHDDVFEKLVVDHGLLEVLHIDFILFEEDVFDQQDLNDLNLIIFHFSIQ